MSHTNATLDVQSTAITPAAVALPIPSFPSDAGPSGKPEDATLHSPGGSGLAWPDHAREAAGADDRDRSAPLDLSDAAAIEELRRILETHGYSETGVNQALGREEGRSRLGTDLPVYLRRLSARTPLNILTKLFCLHARVEAEEARATLAPLTLSQLLAVGLLEVVSHGVQARLAISPCEGLWLAHDFAEDSRARLAADHVLGISPATRTLARLTVRRPAGRVLDLGAGCGIQGLLMAGHCERVTAVDTNPRALNLTAFNARLNRLTNVECRLGNLFAPVAGERFDLILCNPPYVISPESHYQFRDSGAPGDRICEQVVRTAPRHLNEGGLACVLCNWAHPEAEPWHQRLREWIADNGCDSLLLRGATQDPLGYAAAWTRTADAADYDQALSRWCDYYARLGIQALSAGAVILRRRQAAHHWVRTEALPNALTEPCADQLEALLRAEDFLAAHPAESDWLDQAFLLADGLHLHQSLVCRGGRFVLESMRVEFHDGLRFKGLVDASAFRLLAHCDGRRRLGELADRLSRGGAAEGQITRSRAVALVRQLCAHGFLVPVEGAGASGTGSPGGEREPDAQRKPALGHAPSQTQEGSL
ncbi:MAG: methyltransferase [Verrucomicrobia bacterium]|nr:methyltransferase [Verrucomicrobiota bacterium]